MAYSDRGLPGPRLVELVLKYIFVPVDSMPMQTGAQCGAIE
jgi:hypothetical protein